MRGRWILAAAVLTSTIITGGWLLEHGPATGEDLASRQHLFDEVAQHVRRDFVDTLADSAIYRRAIEGALHELHDPHTTFLDPAREATFEERTSGQYGGVGIQMDMSENGLTVIGTLPGTPAEAAGIITGDLVLSIDGKLTKGLTNDEALKRMRGAAGSEVHIQVARSGVSDHMPFTLVRRMIEVNPVQHALILRDGIGYVSLTIFSSSAGPDLAHAIDSLRTAGAHSLILDLRGDPGGLLNEGVKVADLFLDPGQGIVSTRGRVPSEDFAIADNAPQRWADMPLAVLTDSNSASASEIVAGALQDHDRALIVGTATYGKGSAQRLLKLDRGALKITTALWFTPNGRSINRRRPAADVDNGGRPADTTVTRPSFKTDGGRTVLGGGGIVPDVEVPARTAATADKSFQLALGKKLVQFRAALVDFALAQKASHAITSPAFIVTPAMRAQFYAGLAAKGIVVPRATYDSAAPLVSRLLGQQATRYVFGTQAEYLRQLHDDSTAMRAAELLGGVRSPRELLTRATPARPAK